jgi:prefoldin subunit 5
MAKPPSKRRGITLGPRADSAAALDRLSIQPAPSISLAPDQTRPDPETADGDPEVAAESMSEQVVELRRMNADLDSRWRRQAEQLQTQLQQLEQQRDQIARQARQLHALEQTRQTSGRLGVLLGLLALAGAAALGFHTWPRLQDVAADLNRMSTGVAQLAPQLQALGRQVTALTSDMGQMGSSAASLREDVSSVRSDLGSLRQAVNASSEGKGAVQADAGGKRRAAYTVPRNATTMSNPYRGMRPMMPW